MEIKTQRKAEIKKAFSEFGLEVLDFERKLGECDWPLVTYTDGRKTSEIYVYDSAGESAEKAAAFISRF